MAHNPHNPLVQDPGQDPVQDAAGAGMAAPLLAQVPTMGIGGRAVAVLERLLPGAVRVWGEASPSARSVCLACTVLAAIGTFATVCTVGCCLAPAAGCCAAPASSSGHVGAACIVFGSSSTSSTEDRPGLNTGASKS